MSLKDRMKNGMLYIEYGNESEEDKEYEKIIEKQRVECKEIMYDYNNTRPSEIEKRTQLLKGLLGSCGEKIFIETPLHLAYGCNVHVGERFYGNFNLVIVDDGDVIIGDNVMIAPNVTISSTGHPIDPEIRTGGTQFSIPVKIGNNVWIGANVAILPGVTIGENSVIGAGSVVTKDIPANVVAAGNPCRVLREIGEHDKEYYYKNRKI